VIDARFPAGVADGIPVVTTSAEIDITSAEQLRSALLTAAARGPGPRRASLARRRAGRQKRGGNAAPFGIRGLEFPERGGVPAIVADINRRPPGSGVSPPHDYPRYRQGSRMTTIPGHADWREAGACAQLDPDLFFPISSTGPAREQIARAKAICGACPVRRPCLEFALEHDLAHGIWGGTTPQDRQARRRGRRPEPLRTVSLLADALPG